VSPLRQPNTAMSPAEATQELRGRGVQISMSSVRRIIKRHMEMTYRRRINAHFMTPQQKQNCVARCEVWREQRGPDKHRII
jgi:hypothetical protein